MIRIIQGPLAGYSCAPFRRLIWAHSTPEFCTTEMISAKDLRYRKNKPRRFLHRDPLEKKLCYQISGNEPDDLAFATELINTLEPDVIDLNCGCPKPKIRKKNCGAKLLSTPELLFHLISAIKNNTDAQVSIKIRVASPIYDHNDKEVVQAAESAGVDFITVHGRHWTQNYDVPCQIEAIQKIKAFSKVPIIANGDVQDARSLQHILKISGADGVMMCRASMGKPWLIKKIQTELNGEIFSSPSSLEIGEIFKQHLQGLIELDGEHLALLQSRKLAKYYARNCESPTQFIENMQESSTLFEAYQLIDNFFK